MINHQLITNYHPSIMINQMIRTNEPRRWFLWPRRANVAPTARDDPWTADYHAGQRAKQNYQGQY